MSKDKELLMKLKNLGWAEELVDAFVELGGAIDDVLTFDPELVTIETVSDSSEMELTLDKTSMSGGQELAAELEQRRRRTYM